jgi:hypothetical protein
VVTGLYAVLAVALYGKVWTADPSVVTQLGPDVFLNTWFMAAVPHALFSGHDPLVLTAANYPYGVNTLANTSEPLLGIIGYPLTVLFGPLVTFNFWMTVAPVLSGLSAYILARRFTGWRPAAFCAGLLFGFSPYMIVSSYDGHIHLTFLALVPLIFLVLYELVVRQRGSPVLWGLALGALVCAQFFVSVEVLATTAVVGLVALIVTAVVGRRSLRSHLRHLLLGGGVAAGVAAVVLVYPTWVMINGPGHIKGQLQLVPQAYRADLLGPLLPDSFLKLAPSSLQHIADKFSNSMGENGTYIGLPLLAVLVAGAIVLRRRAAVVVVSVTGFVVFVLMLGGALTVSGGPQLARSGGAKGVIPLPEALLQKVPLFDNIVPSRLAAYVSLLAALLLAMVLDRLHARVFASARRSARRAQRHLSIFERVRGFVAPALVALVCLIPLIPSGQVAAEPAHVPSYFTSRQVERIPKGSVALLVPYPSELFFETQLWQISGSSPFRFNMVGGYVLTNQPGTNHAIAFVPGYGYMEWTITGISLVQACLGRPPAETPVLRRQILAQLRSWKVDSVVAPLAFTPHPGTTYRFLTWLLGPPNQATSQSTRAWYDVAKVTASRAGLSGVGAPSHPTSG